MTDNLKTDNQLNLKQYQQLLDKSTKQLNPDIRAGLDQSRRNAIDMLDNNVGTQTHFWRPVIALVVPLFAVAAFIFYPTAVEEEIPTTDIYADLETLMDEEQLDFLAEIEVSEWIANENEGS